MDVKHVRGEKRGKIILYAISTCVWCKKVKKLLNSLNVDYYYIDVDLLDKEEREKAEEEVAKWNPLVSFPTIVINDRESIDGYDEEEIRSKISNGSN
jgi:glutaredoxin-like protein NrdH